MKVDVATSPEILAQRNGRCGGCKAAIRAGEPIVEVQATGKWVHPECVPVEPSRTTTEAGLTASDRSSR